MLVLSKQKKNDFALVIVTIIWGLGFPVTQIAINSGFGTFTILFDVFLVDL